jgi:hypothetical protein
MRLPEDRIVFRSRDFSQTSGRYLPDIQSTIFKETTMSHEKENLSDSSLMPIHKFGNRKSQIQR